MLPAADLLVLSGADSASPLALDRSCDTSVICVSPITVSRQEGYVTCHHQPVRNPRRVRQYVAPRTSKAHIMAAISALATPTTMAKIRSIIPPPNHVVAPRIGSLLASTVRQMGQTRSSSCPMSLAGHLFAVRCRWLGSNLLNSSIDALADSTPHAAARRIRCGSNRAIPVRAHTRTTTWVTEDTARHVSGAFMITNNRGEVGGEVVIVEGPRRGLPGAAQPGRRACRSLTCRHGPGRPDGPRDFRLSASASIPAAAPHACRSHRGPGGQGNQARETHSGCLKAMAHATCRCE